MLLRYCSRCLLGVVFTLAAGSAHAQSFDSETGEPVLGAVPAPYTVSSSAAERGGEDLTLLKHLAAGETRGIALDGEVLYRSNGGYFEALDVSDPDEADLLSRVVVETSIVQDVVVEGDLAYVVSSRSNFPQGAGLHIVDISDPSSLSFVGQALGQTAFGVALGDGYAFVGASTSGLSVYDVSAPSAPDRVAGVSLPGASVLKVAVRDGVAFASGGNAGFATFDVSDPLAPSFLDSLSTGGFATNVALGEDDVAYVTVNGRGLVAFDISDPAALSEIGSFGIASSQVRGVQVAGDVVYVTSRDGF
jgi:hypothetical protein